MFKKLRIDNRFRGPPESGNGGYVAGLLAEELGGSDCQVRLSRPPPLDRDLEIRVDGAVLSLWDGDKLVASAEPAKVEMAPPPAPNLEAAREASAHFTGFEAHIFPGCFVCGPDRAPGDGLRVFAGALNQILVASPWEPTADLCDEHGRVRLRFVWAALDCPGFFAVQKQSGPAVLGQLAVHLRQAPRNGSPLTVVGWPISHDGRKHRAGTALYAGSNLLAAGLATWITI